MHVLLSFAYTDFDFDKEGVFESALIQINDKVYDMSTKEQFKNKALQFTILNIAHEMIHVLTGKIYGETPSNNNKMTPDKPKFKVKIA